MSTIETNLVQPSTGTTLTLGASGDTVDLSNAAVTLPDSAYLANRNMIINGDFNVWQRATSCTAGTYGYNDADRWFFGGNSGAGKQTTRQSGTPQEGFQYHMKVDANGISASNWVGIEQAIETSTVVPLRSQTITVSVYARKGASAQADNSYKLRLAQSNSTDARSTLNFGTGLTDTAMSLTTSFVRYSATVTVASDAVGISCSIVLTAGSSTATADDYIEITGVQLEIGDTATPFEHKSFGQEFADCCRYYQNSYTSVKPDVAPARADCWTTTSWNDGNVNFPVFPYVMRSPPSVVLRNLANLTAGYCNSNGTERGAVANGLGIKLVSYIVVTSGTANSYTIFSWELDAEL